MISIGMLLFFIFSAPAETRCPVTLSLTGTVSGDSGIVGMFFDSNQPPIYFRANKLPYDTTVSAIPWKRIGMGWYAVPGSQSGIVMRVTSRSGSRLIVCDQSEETCGKAWKLSSLSDDCRIE